MKTVSPVTLPSKINVPVCAVIVPIGLLALPTSPLILPPLGNTKSTAVPLFD
ncbi:MAG: hypothetical protein RCG16_04510 [Rickettsia hoogstraalii]